MPEIERTLRYRINISISTKGQKTWECTVDGDNFTQEEILAKSDIIVAELEKRYPMQIEVKEKKNE